MKRTLLISFVCLLFSTASLAQVARGGLKGGFNFSSLYIDDVEDRQIRPGFHAGIFMQKPIAGPLYFQPELVFTTAGNRTRFDEGLNDYTVDYNFNYMQLPLLLNLKVGDSYEFKGGLYTAYLVGGNATYEGEFLTTTTELDRDDFSKIDYGLTFAFGYNMNAVQFGLQYNLGLREVSDTDSARSQIGDVKNVVGQIYVAIGISGE